jgi:hypothetical protein
VTSRTQGQLHRDLTHVLELEDGLSDRLRKVLFALILARETEAHLHRRLDTVEKHRNGRLRSAAVADQAAHQYREVLLSMTNGVEPDTSPLQIAPNGNRSWMLLRKGKPH